MLGILFRRFNYRVTIEKNKTIIKGGYFMATILVKRAGFWAGLGKLCAAAGLLLTGHIDAAIATAIGGFSSMIHSGESKPKEEKKEIVSQ
jgi:hypothetical protein